MSRMRRAAGPLGGLSATLGSPLGSSRWARSHALPLARPLLPPTACSSPELDSFSCSAAAILRGPPQPALGRLFLLARRTNNIYISIIMDTRRPFFLPPFRCQLNRLCIWRQTLPAISCTRSSSNMGECVQVALVTSMRLFVLLPTEQLRPRVKLAATRSAPSTLGQTPICYAYLRPVQVSGADQTRVSRVASSRITSVC